MVEAIAERLPAPGSRLLALNAPDSGVDRCMKIHQHGRLPRIAHHKGVIGVGLEMTESYAVGCPALRRQIEHRVMAQVSLLLGVGALKDAIGDHTARPIEGRGVLYAEQERCRGSRQRGVGESIGQPWLRGTAHLQAGVRQIDTVCRGHAQQARTVGGKAHISLEHRVASTIASTTPR